MESLLLFFSAAALHFARKRRWWLASAASVLAALTKQTGVLLIIPLAMELWADASNARAGRRNALNWLALALAPLAVVGWTALRLILFEGGPDLSLGLQEQFLSLLVSSSATEIVETRPFAWPWHVIAEAIDTAINTPAARWTVAANLGGYLMVIALLVGTWGHLRGSYRAYAAVIVALSLLDFSFNRTFIPVPSLFRHAFLAFPIFAAMPLLVRNGRLRILYAAACLVAFLILAYAYVMNGWII
jgi:hypothetical protein